MLQRPRGNNVTLHLFEISPPSRAAWMTCKAVGLDVNVKSINLLKGEQNSPDFLKINPVHCVPTLDDNGFHLFESRAIMGYLVDTCSKSDSLYPRDPEKRAVVDQYLYYDLGKVFKNCAGYAFPNVVMGKECDATKEDDLKSTLTEVNGTVLGKKKKYVTGEVMTIADISLAASLTFLELVKYDFAPYPELTAWLGRMKGLPYWKECNEGQFKVHEMIKASRAKGQ